MTYLILSVIAMGVSNYNAKKNPTHFLNRTQMNKKTASVLMGLIWPATAVHKTIKEVKKRVK